MHLVGLYAYCRMMRGAYNVKFKRNVLNNLEGGTRKRESVFDLRRRDFTRNYRLTSVSDEIRNSRPTAFHKGKQQPMSY